MKKLIFLLTAMLVSLSFVNVADARPKDKRSHYKVYKYNQTKTVTVDMDHINRNLNYYPDDDSHAAYFARERARQEAAKVQTTNVAKRSTKPKIEDQDLVNRAYAYIGSTASQLGLPKTLWCADFMNMLVGGNDRRAISYKERGTPAPYGCVNCVAITTRKGGQHVGVVSGYDEGGNPIIISGNHNRRVGVGVYAKRKVIAYRYV